MRSGTFCAIARRAANRNVSDARIILYRTGTERSTRQWLSHAKQSSIISEVKEVMRMKVEPGYSALV
jgi:hypothetical protein